MMTRLALPLARLYLKKRAKKQPAYLEHWNERFGWCTYPSPKKPRIWLHAVSVGETQASRSLIEALFKTYPNCELLLTCMTPTGRDVGAKLCEKYPDRITQCYLPYDTPELVAKFLDETRPKLALLMETEVWPNLIEATKERSIPLVLANARESEKSRRQAARFMSVMRPAFAGFDLVLAQSEEDKIRLQSLGARTVYVCGSVKFDIRPDSKQQTEANRVKQKLARPVLLMASTRQGEEKELLAYVEALPPNVLVWLVPRHPQRFDEVKEELSKVGLNYVRKTKIERLDEIHPSTRVVLADTMGEMSFSCALGDVCIMGGSFGNFGCQNLIEPAAAGVPVIVGPSSFNFAKAVDDAVALGAARRVQNAKEALDVASEWLTDANLTQRSKNALRFAESYTGATQKMIEKIVKLCPTLE